MKMLALITSSVIAVLSGIVRNLRIRRRIVVGLRKCVVDIVGERGSRADGTGARLRTTRRLRGKVLGDFRREVFKDRAEGTPFIPNIRLGGDRRGVGPSDRT